MLCIQVSARFVSFSEYTALQFQNCYSEVTVGKIKKKNQFFHFSHLAHTSIHTVVWDVTM